MFFDKLETFNQSQGFVDGTANWQIVNRHLTNNIACSGKKSRDLKIFRN
jgi:hypothetical protein